jgi:hypothetical protein
VIFTAGELQINNADIIGESKTNMYGVVNSPSCKTTMSNCDLTISSSTGSYGIYNRDNANIEIDNCEINAASQGVGNSYGIYNRPKASALINHCSIDVETASGTCDAIANFDGEVAVKNSTLNAESNDQSKTDVYAVGIYTSKTLNVENCTITAVASAGSAIALEAGQQGNCTIDNTSMIATSENNNGTAMHNSGIANVTNSELLATAPHGFGYGFANLDTANATLTNNTIEAYGNYSYNYNVGAYNGLTVGVSNYGEIELNDCAVYGNHSGVSNHNLLYVHGGTYEGYGHGGFYLSGTSYIYNAEMRECQVKNGYVDNGVGSNKSGMYIGGASGFNVYMDNCNIYGTAQPIVLRNTRGEHDNALYISNSHINTNAKIRIDDTTHKVYIGTGNNFNESNTTLPAAVVLTKDIYTNN